MLRETGVSITQRNDERVLSTTHIRRESDDARRMLLICPGTTVSSTDAIFAWVLLVLLLCRATALLSRTPLTRMESPWADSKGETEKLTGPTCSYSHTPSYYIPGSKRMGAATNIISTSFANLRPKKLAIRQRLIQKPAQVAYLQRRLTCLGVAVQSIVVLSILRPAGADTTIARERVQKSIILSFRTCTEKNLG